MDTQKNYYAHSREGKPLEGWHELKGHLESTAELARRFADSFGAGDWGYPAGLWHDFEFMKGGKLERII